MILIINICKDGLHYHEFVRPIEDIMRSSEEPFVTRHYSELTYKDLNGSHRIIITGTSLQDFEYSKNIERFGFLKEFRGPILAICGGMQIICTLYGCKMMKGSEIGLIPVNFTGEFLGMKGRREVYALHNISVKNDATLKRQFGIFANTEYIQALRHVHHPIYCVMFHPEVRNKSMITEFLKVNG